MIFTSVEFLFVFLPALTVFYGLATRLGGAGIAIWVLILASLVFYAAWNPWNLILLLGSLAVNYALSWGLDSLLRKRLLLVAGVVLNLGVLVYFKYWHFLSGIAVELGFTSVLAAAKVLPLGISFITFQKLAFLIDRYQGKCPHPKFYDFLLFVTFFPQLIAGPIVHHSQFIPQLRTARPMASLFAAGVLAFAVGAAKKVLLADMLAPGVEAAFAEPQLLGGLSAWYFLMAYTLQLYLDFSGYSDMAVGLALMFGLRLPWNFLSPLKATSVIEFWRAWHITLSNFLKTYVYAPLGGSREGRVRMHRNLLITMLIGGVWHGAGWTFLLWGLLHGMALSVAHLWRKTGWSLNQAFAWGLTVLVISLGWVLFRSSNFGAAADYYRALFSWQRGLITHLPFITDSIPYFATAFVISFFAKNTKNLVEGFSPNLRTLGFTAGLLFLVTLAVLAQGGAPKFLYFDF